jgi:hypothetical protein
LYYSNKLANANTIQKIIVWAQGLGAINNLGALRTQSLEDWGNYNPKTSQVYQWDGLSLSPVVHQYDRDKHLHNQITRIRHREWMEQYQEAHKQS